MSGEVVFNPWVGAGEPAPGCVALPKGLTSIAIVYLPGDYRTKDGRWRRRDRDAADKKEASVENPLEHVWEAAMAVKAWLVDCGIKGAYVVPVVVFTDMEPDDDIRTAAAGKAARVLFGLQGHVEALASLLGVNDLRNPLTRQYIDESMAALTNRSDASVRSSTAKAVDLGKVGDHPVIHRVDVHIDTVHVYVTMAAPDGDVEGVLPTVSDG